MTALSSHPIGRWWPFIAFALFLLVLASLFFAGYRLGPGASLLRTHTLTLTALPADTQIFVDGSPEASRVEGTVKIQLLRGNHTILASAPSAYPWEAVVAMPNTDASVVAFLIPKSIPVSIIPKSREGEIKKILASYTLPTKEKPLALAGGCALISVSDNRIIAEVAPSPACTPPAFLCIEGVCAPTEIFSPLAPLRSVLPYPGHQDALLVAVGNEVFALGLDPRQPRAFAPVLSGEAPVIASDSSGAVVGRDGGTFFSLEFLPVVSEVEP